MAQPTFEKIIENFEEYKKENLKKNLNVEVENINFNSINDKQEIDSFQSEAIVCRRMNGDKIDKIVVKSEDLARVIQSYHIDTETKVHIDCHRTYSFMVGDKIKNISLEKISNFISNCECKKHKNKISNQEFQYPTKIEKIVENKENQLNKIQTEKLNSPINHIQSDEDKTNNSNEKNDYCFKKKRL
ncbi:hypothetical protein ACTFIY_008516 [Dictyostelium cf. discoideum]